MKSVTDAEFEMPGQHQQQELDKTIQSWKKLSAVLGQKNQFGGHEGASS